MTARFTNIIFIITFILAVFTYSFWFPIKQQTGLRIFYPFTALMFLGYTYVIHLLFKKIYSKGKRNFIVPFSRVVYLTTVNNLIDEIFFNPREIGLNEYIGFLVIVLISFYNYYKNERNDFGRKKRN